MKTHQLNARIDQKAFIVLRDLTEKLHTTKGHLTEKAIYLLKEHFERIESAVGQDKSADVFLALLTRNTKDYDELYQKLAKPDTSIP